LLPEAFEPVADGVTAPVDEDDSDAQVMTDYNVFNGRIVLAQGATPKLDDDCLANVPTDVRQRLG
jgi:hypothetical protein